MPIAGGDVTVNYPAADTGSGLAFAMYTARKAPMLTALGGVPAGLTSGQWDTVVHNALVALGATTKVDEVALVDYFIANGLGATSGSAKGSCRALASAAITVSGLQTIDGVVLAGGDRVWRTGDGIGNGAWIVSAGAWSRAADMAAGTEGSGSFALIEEGTAFGGHMSVCTSAAGKTVGTDALTFNNNFGIGGGGGFTPAGTTSQVLLGDGSAAGVLPTGLTVGGESLASIKSKADAASTFAPAGTTAQVLLGDGSASGALPTTATVGGETLASIKAKADAASTFAPAGTTSQVLLGDGSASNVPRAAIPTAGASLVGGIALPGASTGKFLKDDGTFAAPGGGAASAGYGLFSARPAAGTRGALYYCTNSALAFIDNGVSWDVLIPGILPLGAAPVAASWTIVDPGGAADGGTGAITPTTIVDGVGVVTFAGGVVGVRLSTATVAFNPAKKYILGIKNTPTSGGGVYLVLQQGSDSGAEIYAIGEYAGTYNTGHWQHLSNRVAFDYTTAMPTTAYLFFKAEVVGGNYVLSYSSDGETFLTQPGLATIATGGTFTPTRVGFGFMANTNAISMVAPVFDVR